MISRMDQMLGNKPKPEDKPAAKPEPKPEAGQAKPKPGAKPEPAPDDADDPKVGDKELRKRYKETKAEMAKLRAERQSEVQSLQSKIATLENKRYWTEDDEKRHAGLESQLKQLQADLYGQNFRTSPEFKQNFVEKWHKLYETAVQRVKAMPVKQTDADGMETERQASQTDFERVRKAPLEEQWKVARGLFGDAAYLVLNEVNALRQIEQAGEEAAETARKSYDERRQAYENQMKSSFQNFSQSQEAADRQLIEKYPQWFAPDESDPEATKALQEGEQFVNAILQQSEQMKPEDRGANAAILRRWATSFPRLVHTINVLRGRLEERDKELAAYKKTDPSHSMPAESGTPTPAEKVENTKSLSAVFAGR